MVFVFGRLLHNRQNCARDASTEAIGYVNYLQFKPSKDLQTAELPGKDTAFAVLNNMKRSPTKVQFST